MADFDEQAQWDSLHPSTTGVLLQLERLRRNYYHSISTHDQIALFELSHSLRIWTDMIKVLPTIAPAFGTKRVFKSACPHKTVMRALKGLKYIVALIPGGARTLANRGSISSTPDLPPDVDFIGGGVVKVNADGSLTLSSYFYAVGKVDRNQMTRLGKPDISKYSYVDWMGAEVVRISLPGEEHGSGPMMISRATLINRVANTFDGSHPSVAPDPRTGMDKADPAIEELFKHGLGGLPLPYFLLIKIAEDILEHAGELLGIPKPKTLR